MTHSNSRGLYLIESRKVTDLTQLSKGLPTLDIQGVENFSFRLNYVSLVTIINSLSQIDTKEYIPVSKIGFDKKNNELLVSNNSYEYSYVFNFESGFWHKISESYRVLINFYPELLVLRENTSVDGVYSLSRDNYETPVSIMLTTRPCKLDGEVDFTLLHRAIQRCEIETKDSVYAGFYVFGSNDLKTWQLLTGSDRKTGTVTDIFLTRTHLKVKYYIFLFAAQLKENSTINTLDIQFYHKLMSKIR